PEVLTLLTVRTPLRSPLFPYTTLFRSEHLESDLVPEAGPLGDSVVPEHGGEPGLRGLLPGAKNVHVVVLFIIEVPEDQARRSFRSEEHTSELQSRENLVCRLLPEQKKK